MKQAIHQTILVGMALIVGYASINGLFQDIMVPSPSTAFFY